MTQDATRPDPSRPAPAPRNGLRWALTLGAAVVSAAIGYAAIYGIGGGKRNAAADAVCADAVSRAKALTPLIRGEVAALAPAQGPLVVPDIAFDDTHGTPKKLSDWRGRTVLLNLWATWCVPCRKEMPALDALQRQLGGPDFEVVAVNIDTRDPDRPKSFFRDTHLTALGYFTDAKAKSFQDLKAVGRALGMPTSVLIDPRGCEIATIAGPAEWASDDAIKLISTALDRAPRS